MIDLSRLPAPDFIEELDYEEILAQARESLRKIMPEWSGYELESDPANKILEVFSYREMMIRQRINEAVRAVMVAFSQGNDLGHLAAFYPLERLPGALPTFEGTLALSAPLSLDSAIPADFRVITGNGEVEARLMNNVVIAAGNISASGLFEIVKPIGTAGNGTSAEWRAITPLPFLLSVKQKAASSGGSDIESDDKFRQRIPQTLESYSVAGPTGAYEFWARSADARIRDAVAYMFLPGVVRVVLLSEEGDGTADAAMISRVHETLSATKVRPLTDFVQVVGAEIINYSVSVRLVLYSGVAGEPPLTDAEKRLRERIESLRGIGKDVTLSALISAAHVEGVKRVELLTPVDDITVTKDQVARCVNVTVTAVIADEA